jgi:hypothetical protein
MYPRILCAAAALLIAVAVQPATADDATCYDVPALGDGTVMQQKAFLYEEDSADPDGVEFVGDATWCTERIAPANGQNPEVAIRGGIEIPERKISVRLSLRRSSDQQLRASHTVEIIFKLPPAFSHGGVESVPGIVMKETEKSRAFALTGNVVKVEDNFFAISLSSREPEMQRNVQLLKNRSWLGIPIVYGDGKRALLTIEKGPPGESAFSEAFAAWELPLDTFPDPGAQTNAPAR